MAAANWTTNDTAELIALADTWRTEYTSRPKLDSIARAQTRRAEINESELVAAADAWRLA